MPERKKFDSQTKVSILRRHLQKKEKISDLCEEFGFTPGTYYQWQDTLFSRGHTCFDVKNGRPVDEKKQKVKLVELEQKIDRKNKVISELMEELLLEKKLGGAN